VENTTMNMSEVAAKLGTMAEARAALEAAVGGAGKAREVLRESAALLRDLFITLTRELGRESMESVATAGAVEGKAESVYLIPYEVKKAIKGGFWSIGTEQALPVATIKARWDWCMGEMDGLKFLPSMDERAVKAREAKAAAQAAAAEADKGVAAVVEAAEAEAKKGKEAASVKKALVTALKAATKDERWNDVVACAQRLLELA